MIRPLRGKLIIKFDPPPPPTSGLVRAQEDYLDICKLCATPWDRLGDTRCIGRPIFELDEIHDVDVYRGEDYSHERERIRRPADVGDVLPATVIVSAHPDFSRGDRVLANFGAGESVPPDDGLSPVRIVRGGPDGQVFATIEED